MKILFVDTGLSEAVALRLADEGNKVFYYSVWESAHPSDGDVLYGKGLLEDHKNIERVQNWQAYVDKVDFISFSDISFGETVDSLLKAGYKVFGTKSKGEKLEADRTFPKKEFSHLHYPKSRELRSVESAISYITTNFSSYDRVVVKLSGFVRGSYVSYSPDDAVDWIKDNVPGDVNGEDIKIIVQQYIDGVEVAVGAWASQHFPLLNYGWNMNFEHKKKFPGDLGPNTGEMGTVLFWADVYDTNKLIQETLLPMSTWLRHNYGNQYVDINLMVERGTGKVYVIEFTSRFGYPHILITLPLIQSDFGALMWSLASGQPTDVKYDTRVAVGIGINIAGYPFDCAMEQYYNKKFSIVYPDNKDVRKYYVPAGVYKNKDDKENEFRVVPGHGRVFVTVGVGETLVESQLMAVELAQTFRLPDMIWRYDIGDRLYYEIPLLLEQGYISTPRAQQMIRKF